MRKTKVLFHILTEFQIRGLPHLHGVFWLNEIAVKKYKDEKGDFMDNVTELIDKWVSCSLETGNPQLNDLVKEVNVHNHTKSCQKGSMGCRFSFPRLPSDETLIAHPIPDEELESQDPVVKDQAKLKLHNSKQILKKVKEKLTELTDEEIEAFGNDLNALLEKLEIDKKDYHDALRISQRGKTVVLKRKLNERRVNNYNPHMLMAWQANMDIQFCLDNYAVVTYITDYMTKGDAGLTRELRKALLETKGCNDWETLNYLKMVYFKHKQVSVAEATYRLINGLCLKKSNITCTYIGTGFPKNRSTFLNQLILKK